DRGANVYGLARGEERLRRAADNIGEAFHPIVCDVSDADQVQQTVERVASEAGRIDVLINNAGIGMSGSIDEISVEDWGRAMAVDAGGVCLCAQAVIPHMRGRNAESGFGGQSVDIASIAGLRGSPRRGAYSAWKFAVRGFS